MCNWDVSRYILLYLKCGSSKFIWTVRSNIIFELQLRNDKLYNVILENLNEF